LSAEENKLSEYLRRKREEKGMSLRQISDITRIKLRFLEALEDGDFSPFKSESHVRTFIMAYARTIHIDEDEPLKIYESMLRSDQAEEAEVLNTSRVREVRGKRTTSYILLLAAVIVSLLVVSHLRDRYGVSRDTGTSNSSINREAVPPTDSPAAFKPAETAPDTALEAAVDTGTEDAAASEVPPITVGWRSLISGHGVNSRGREYWWVYAQVKLNGLRDSSDIVSLSYISPENKVCQLEPMVQPGGKFNGIYVHSDRNLDRPPPLGKYRFTAVKRAGGELDFTVRLTSVFESLPEIIRPLNHQVLDTGVPEIEWVALPEAVSYNVYVRKANDDRVWVRRDVVRNRVVFNDNGKAKVDTLPPGEYIISVYARDKRGNLAVRHVTFSVAG